MKNILFTKVAITLLLLLPHNVLGACQTQDHENSTTKPRVKLDVSLPFKVGEVLSLTGLPISLKHRVVDGKFEAMLSIVSKNNRVSIQYNESITNLKMNLKGLKEICKPDELIFSRDDIISRFSIFDIYLDGEDSTKLGSIFCNEFLGDRILSFTIKMSTEEVINGQHITDASLILKSLCESKPSKDLYTLIMSFKECRKHNSSIKLATFTNVNLSVVDPSIKDFILFSPS